MAGMPGNPMSMESGAIADNAPRNDVNTMLPCFFNLASVELARSIHKRQRLLLRTSISKICLDFHKIDAKYLLVEIPDIQINHPP
jgi:hypothetical protein